MLASSHFLHFSSRFYHCFKDPKECSPDLLSRMEADFLSLIPETLAEKHHHSWGHNILARYYCYEKKDFSKSLSHLILANKLAKDFWQHQFDDFDVETKSIPLIVALNVARLQFHTGQLSRGKDYLGEMERYLFEDGRNELPLLAETFPFDTNVTYEAIHKIKTEEIRRSFLDKISIEKAKWNI